MNKYRIIETTCEWVILILGFLLIVLPEIIYFTLAEIKDWIGDKLRWRRY